MKRDKHDKTISELIVAAADYACQICGSVDGTHQTMHDISRTYVITRYDSRNLICGCAKCHFATGKDPYFHAECFRKIKGSEEVRLNRERAHSGDRLKPWEKDEIRKHWQSEMERINNLRSKGITGKIELTVPDILL